jgi:hypothetical protein
MKLNGIEVPDGRIAEYCREWQVAELSLFGSVLRPDFRPDSDVDVLVSFGPEAHWSLYDIVEMMDQLKEMFNREVDLVEKEALRNPFRRNEILATRKVIYAA